MKVESLSVDWLNKNFDPKSSLLVASLFSDEKEISNNIYYLTKFKDIILPKPLIENKMALLGVKNLDNKGRRFQTPLDFIKNISKD